MFHLEVFLIVFICLTVLLCPVLPIDWAVLLHEVDLTVACPQQIMLLLYYVDKYKRKTFLLARPHAAPYCETCIIKIEQVLLDRRVPVTGYLL